MTNTVLIAANDNVDFVLGQTLTSSGLYSEIDAVFPVCHSPAEQAALMAEAKAHYEVLFPETKAGAAQGLASKRLHGKTSGQKPAPAFVTIVVDRAGARRGWSESSVKQVVLRGERIRRDVLDAIMEDGEFDKSVWLDKLTRVDPEYQMGRYLSWKSEEPPTPNPAPVLGGDQWWCNVPDFVANAERFYVPGYVDLRLGDSRTMLNTFEPETFDSVVTDNPYGIDYHDAEGETVEGDEDPDEVAGWLAPALARLMKPHSFAILHGVWRVLDDGREVTEVFRAHTSRAGMPMKRICVWNKELASPHGRYLRNQHELVWICAKGAATPCEEWTDHWGIIGEVGNIVTKDVDVWTIRQTDGVHTTSKPEALHMREMETFAPKNGSILDPCMGSGVTAVAALRTGRSYVGIEVKARWFSEAVSRVEAELAVMQPPATELSKAA